MVTPSFGRSRFNSGSRIRAILRNVPATVPAIGATMSKYTAQIVHDTHCTLDDLLPNPIMQITYASNRYTLGTECLDVERMRQIESDSQYFSLPVFAYIHGAVALSLGKFSCDWDSGQSGIIYATKADLAREAGHKRWCAATRIWAERNAQALIAEVGQILNGDVYGFQILDDNNDCVDSCFGYVGREYAEQAAQESLEYFNAENAGQCQAF
jgi:hypothetical protein